MTTPKPELASAFTERIAAMLADLPADYSHEQRLAAVRQEFTTEVAKRMHRAGVDGYQAVLLAETRRGFVHSTDDGSFVVDTLTGGRQPVTINAVLFVANELAAMMQAGGSRR